MKEIEMTWSTARATYDLIVDGEWYAEGNYEQMEQMRENIRLCEIEEEEARCSQPESDYYGDTDDWDEC